MMPWNAAQYPFDPFVIGVAIFFSLIAILYDAAHSEKS